MRSLPSKSNNKDSPFSLNMIYDGRNERGRSFWNSLNVQYDLCASFISIDAATRQTILTTLFLQFTIRGMVHTLCGTTKTFRISETLLKRNVCLNRCAKKVSSASKEGYSCRSHSETSWFYSTVKMTTAKSCTFVFLYFMLHASWMKFEGTRKKYVYAIINWCDRHGLPRG